MFPTNQHRMCWLFPPVFGEEEEQEGGEELLGGERGPAGCCHTSFPPRMPLNRQIINPHTVCCMSGIPWTKQFPIHFSISCRSHLFKLLHQHCVTVMPMFFISKCLCHLLRDSAKQMHCSAMRLFLALPVNKNKRLENDFQDRHLPVGLIT